MPENRLAADLEHILEQTRELWNELRGERIFITGGTGFFGCWLLESFAWANERLGLESSALVLTRNLEAFRKKAPHLAGNPAIQFHPGEICSFKPPSGQFPYIIHAATESSAKLNLENPLNMFETIVNGTQHMLEFAGKCGAHKLLLTSSGAVYGKQPSELIRVPEEYAGAPDPTDPRSAYGEGKRAAETLCALHAKQYAFEVKIARCFAFVGPYLPLDIHYAIGNFMRNGLTGGPIVVLGDGTPTRSYLYAADLAIWLWKIFLRGKSLRPYNVGSDESIPIVEVARRVAGQFPTRIEVEIRGTPDPLKPLERYVPDIQRGKNELDLQVWTGLSDGIQRSLRYFGSSENA
jgi:nucleoside-diphosphate-sugar epimerase